MLRFPRPADDHEGWFGAYYAQLLIWATQLTGRNREQAEDLVHDVFVQFMARCPDLTTIQNPEGYLYTSLRHHHLANARRAARLRHTVSTDDFDLLAHDSLPHGFKAWRARQAAGSDEPFAQQLREVWRYAQHRKRTAKAASVLLLRFFHGYYPGEIAQVLRVPRLAVGRLLHLARKEARLFMADPDAAAPLPPDAALFNPADLAVALRDAALRSDPDGVCLTETEIAALYRTPVAESLPASTAAHVVSCAACLTRTNRVLGLRPLEDRHPLDSLGYERDEPPSRGGSGGGSGGAAGGAARQARRRGLDDGRRRLADLLTHQPRQLRIAVNGIVLGSQSITSAVSRQTFRVTQPAFDFLEVLSETETRLLLLSVEVPPHGPVDVHDTIALSDGRRLDVRVDFSADTPEVEVSYVDHALAVCPLQARAPRPSPVEPPVRPSLGERLRRWMRPLVRPVADAVDAPRWRLTRGRAFTMLAAVLALTALLLHQFGHSVLSAAELLERSRVAEALWRSSRVDIVHRTLDVDVRSARTGTTTRRRVEVWHSGSRGLTVRRAYDESGRLLAGEWIDAKGGHTVHRSRTAEGAAPTLSGRDVWRLEPSADDFSRIVGNIERVVARQEADRFLVVFTGARPPQGDVVSASLTLRDDWRAVEQHVVVHRSGDTIAYSWIERARTTMPAERAPANAFDMDDAFVPVTPPAASLPRAVPRATASLEIAALTALRRIDADLGEEVRVRRAGDRLSVTGIVASTERRAQILSVLGAVRRDPAAQVQIEILEEVHARARRRGAGSSASPLAGRETATALSFETARIPLHDDVRASLVAAGVAESVADEEVMRSAGRIVQRAQAMRLHAWALRRVVDGVSGTEVAAMAPTTRDQWRGLIGEHARAFLAEARALSSLVRLVVPEAAPPSDITGPVVLDDRALYEHARAFVETATSLDTVVRAAFVLPATTTPPAAPTPAVFWQSVHRATTAAGALDRATPISRP